MLKRREALTDAQRATLEAVRKMHERTSMTPTQRELGRVLGVTQKAIRQRLLACERKGYIRLLPRVARGIILIDAARA